ncbi:hypothetical protein ACF07V_03585 [Streptomyces sp. NPDC015661]|uniref:hypothetical protein n=1 Tax=Streptomyces sp. NPDC015661 TaxID=3364961 RepID=UPI0036FE3529
MTTLAGSVLAGAILAAGSALAVDATGSPAAVAHLEASTTPRDPGWDSMPIDPGWDSATAKA